MYYGTQKLFLATLVEKDNEEFIHKGDILCTLHDSYNVYDQINKEYYRILDESTEKHLIMNGTNCVKHVREIPKWGIFNMVSTETGLYKVAAYLNDTFGCFIDTPDYIKGNARMKRNK